MRASYHILKLCYYAKTAQDNFFYELLIHFKLAWAYNMAICSSNTINTLSLEEL